MTEAVRLVVNASLCDGHGICALRCPDLITLDQWGYAAVESTTVTEDRVRRRAGRAVAACPNRALDLVAVPPTPVGQPGPRLVLATQPMHNESPQGTEKRPGVHNRNNEGG